LFDLHIDSLDVSCKESRLLELNHDKVVVFCTKAWDFPFLVKRITLDVTDLVMETYADYLFGYRLPTGISQVVDLNGETKHRFAVRFGALWCDIADPVVDYLPSVLETDAQGNYTAPPDFLALVAYQLALHVAPSLDPESDAMANAAQLYQMTLTNIKENESRSNDRERSFGAIESWVENTSFDMVEYRRQLFEDSR
jgi:hypothetical protein